MVQCLKHLRTISQKIDQMLFITKQGIPMVRDIRYPSNVTNPLHCFFSIMFSVKCFMFMPVVWHNIFNLTLIMKIFLSMSPYKKTHGLYITTILNAAMLVPLAP